MKKKVQDFIVEALFKMAPALKSQNKYVGNMQQDGAYTYILSSFCDKYSNSFYNETDDSIFNMYHGSIIIDDIDHIKKSVFISENAYDALNDPLLEQKYNAYHNKNKKKNSFGKYFHDEMQLYFEHLNPMSQSRKKYVNKCQSGKKITKNEVEECFKYCALALIKKEESKHLDGRNGPNNKNNHVTETDLTMLTQLYNTFPQLVDSETINYANNLKDSGASLKDNGNGLIRLVHLANEGVVFVDKDGNSLCLPKLIKMLNDFNFVLDQFC